MTNYYFNDHDLKELCYLLARNVPCITNISIAVEDVLSLSQLHRSAMGNTFITLDDNLRFAIKRLLIELLKEINEEDRSAKDQNDRTRNSLLGV